MKSHSHINSLPSTLRLLLPLLNPKEDTMFSLVVSGISPLGRHFPCTWAQEIIRLECVVQ